MPFMQEAEEFIEATALRMIARRTAEMPFSDQAGRIAGSMEAIGYAPEGARRMYEVGFAEVHAGTIEDLRLYLPGALGARKASAGIYATLCAVVRESVIWADTHAKMLLASGPLGTVSCTGSANLAGTGALEFVRVTTDPEMHAHLTALLDSVRPAADPPLPAAAMLERARARFERYSGGNAATDAGAAAVQAQSSASPAVVSSVPLLDLSKCWAPPPADETARDEEPFRLNPRQLHIHRAVDGLLPE